MGDTFRERLRRLRREQPGPSVPERTPSSRQELPVWLRHRLRKARPTAGGATTRPRTVGPPQGLVDLEGPLGRYAARDTLLAVGSGHGAYALDEARAIHPGALRLLTRGALPEQLEVEQAVFLDIETTGLSGGAGTQSFLVGLGWFEDDSFLVRQAFLRGPEQERALLAACAERLASARLLVSFFGKSFDRHRLEDKMRVHGVEPPFAGLPHADLYWPCRRLYGAALPDTRLVTMERALCAFERSDDLPGAFAPAAWFDFLAERGHLLEEVFRHNLHDVLSLVVLLAHVGRAPLGTRADGAALEADAALGAARARALAALYLERREAEQALGWIARARVLQPGGARDLDRLEAQALLRAARREEALTLLLRAAEGGRDTLAAECLVEAAGQARRLGRAAEEVGRLARRGLELAAVTTSGSRRARLERAAGRELARVQAAET